MRLSLFRRALVPAVAATLLLASSPALAAPPPPFRDPSLPLATRIDDLLSRLTADEKISLLHQYQPAIPRLGIGVFKTGTEALHGVAWSTDYDNSGAVVKADGTVFPQAIGLATSWDPALVKQVGAAVGQEARGFNARNPTLWGLNLWAPVVNLLRDPRWGRNEEGYSEDPYLTGEFAKAYGHGMQGDDPRYLQAAPTLKHFLAYNNEVNRDTTSSSVPPKILHDYDEQAFKIPLEAGAANAVMPSYNLVNGRPNHVSPDLDGKLRKWAPDDIAVVSDAGAPSNLVNSEKYYATKAEGDAAAIKAGLDSFTDNDTDGSITVAAVKEALAKGFLTMADVENADRHLLSLRFRLGEFDPPGRNPYAKITPAVIGSPEHQALARKAADAQMVLLRNNGGALPLNAAKNKKVAVVGSLSNTLYEDWYAGAMQYKVTPLQGIKERLGSAGTVASSEGVDRIALKDLGTGRYLTAPATTGKITAGGTVAGTAESFDVYDWGAGKNTLRAAANGKFLSYSGGALVNDVDQPAGWFVQQQLKLDAQPDGSYVLEYAGNEVNEPWFGPNKFAVVGADGVLTISSPDAAHATKFGRDVLSSGVGSAVAAAKDADTAVVVVGSMPFINGREANDRTSTELAPAQRALIEAVQKANPHTIVVVENSYPTTGWDTLPVPGILWTSHAGQETGHAVADVLFGDTDPSGRLTQTWYASDAGLPNILDYDIAKTGMTYQYYRGKPLFPFGYGLSYTSFRYDNVRASLAGGQVRVSVDVTNTGARSGSDVVQLYSKNSGVQRLRDFSKLTLAPKETRTVRFDVPVADLASWDVARDRSVVAAGVYEFSVGRNASELSAPQPVYVPGERPQPRDLSRPTQAQNFDDYSGTTLTDTSKVSGTSVATAAGSWVAYRNVALNGPGRFSASVSATASSKVTVRLDSPTGRVLGTVPVSPTGDRYAYTTVTAALAKASGRHDVYLTFDGPVNLATFSLR
ncbi:MULTISPECIES: glycoside hydrolase family 3 C-terminal domain-containing protein [unclassified Amycolatopsis]|uniref:glycoside hydrolase family 3 C-terminal domain-containing protein n=1 Tax=unclassified Amycolatopsis TaxID=2618356 RepID=UPI002875A5D8|nr:MULTISPECIES: glycoside hydrolase family 3 C-terminal domain-containing protein [unclassified Amycolatopsis]MDS0139601.1 glycoside hydrolase family 3 C-terminal domain-containing protein [Amycolatopsis sp. 505]MDS0147180.1 glycoside hydrolase family 3 C-terminal domain-containing protein [Amycolatopsis sp. CM201R]